MNSYWRTFWLALGALSALCAVLALLAPVFEKLLETTHPWGFRVLLVTMVVVVCVWNAKRVADNA